MKIINKVFCFSVLVLCFAAYSIYAAPKGQTVLLDGIYVTSVSGTNGASNLIDGNEKTSWTLMPGAGVDEGVMLNFSNFYFIQSMLISAADRNISAFEIYINGQLLRSGDGPGRKILLNSNVKTLYIKISQAVSSSGKLSLNEIYLFGRNDVSITCEAPAVLKGKIEGSSVLSPEEAYNYDFLFDSRRDFGWADGNEKKSGENEFLRFNFEKKVNISKIKIWNGYHRSKTHFDKNEAVRDFTFSDASASGRYTVPSGYMPYEIDFNKVFSGKVFTLTVNSVRKGASYKDLVISELMFFDGKKWFVMETGGSEIRKRNVISKAKSGVLSGFIDRRKVYFVNAGGRNLTQSLILRSNGSFVVYRNDISGSVKQTVIADGNWQIMKNSPGTAEVKIFGRMRSITETERIVEQPKEDTYNPYAGESTAETTVIDKSDKEVIFSDVLDITPNSVKSRKKIIEPMTI